MRRLVQYPLDPLPLDCYPRNSRELRAALEAERPDLVAFCRPHLVHLVKEAPRGARVIAILDESWAQLIAAESEQSGRGRLEAWRALREARRYTSVYRRVNRTASAVVAISEDEKRLLSKHIAPEKIVVIPHGIDTTYFVPQSAPQRDIDVLVVGNLASPRNYVGAARTWNASLACQASSHWRWAFVGRIDPDLRSRLAGTGATVTGVVDDIRPYYARARTVLVPALAGSGVKTTAIQAWAMGRPLVASRLGARGLPARHAENILIGETPEELVGHLISVITDSALAERLAEEGRLTAEIDCDLSRSGRAFARLCNEVVANTVACPQVQNA